MSIRGALAALLGELREVAEPWVVSGSTAAALHGVPVTPGDIDLETTAAGARDIGDRLRRYEVHPVAFSGTAQVRSHYGTFRIDEVVVEVMGDLQIRTAAGWSAPFLTGRAPVTVRTPYGVIPVAAADALADQYDRLGRPKRATPLRVRGPQ